MDNNVKQINCKDSYVQDMARYSIITNRRRNIPDRKDGLKPVQRRILWDMYDHGHAVSEATKVKSAAITGSTMELYHPHGNSSIYDAMQPICQPFACKAPLLNTKSNFGTIMGDSAAAERYTEVWLSKFAIENVIGSLATSKSVVDMTATYTNKTMEPDYLPVKVPLLLINGATGIGLGMKVDIPKHNMIEVIDATLRLMDNPKADVVLIPDHCLPCNIVDTNWKSICNKGNGKYRARAIIDITEEKGRPLIVIKSLPDSIRTDKIFNQINELVAAGKLPQVSDINDASKKNVNILVQLKKGADAQFVREALFKYTDCEHSYNVNFEVIDGVEPIRMSYKSYLESFIDFAMVNKFREYCNKMQDVKTRLHQLDAYIKVIKSGEMDNIISMIKKQSTIDDGELIEFLIKKLKLTDLQATFIINANIKKLSLGYLNKYTQEAKELSKLENEYTMKIVDDSFIKDEVRKDLIDARTKYGTPRICKVIKAADDSNIPKGVFKIVITENNYIRKLGENDPVYTVKGDAANFILKADNTENILLFDNKGKVFKLPVSKVAIVGRSDPGFDIRGIVRGLTANIIAIMYEPMVKDIAKLKMKYYVAVVSKKNCIKKLDIDDFLNVAPSGLIYAKLNDGDEIKDIQILTDSLDAIIYSGNKALRVSGKEIPCYKRNAIGVSAMNTNKDIEGLSIIYPKATSIIVVTKNGRINKFNVSGFVVDKRNKAGASVIKLSSGDSIHSIYGAEEDDIINIVTSSETLTIPVSSIQTTSSIASGLKIVATKNDKIVKVSMSKQQ